MASVSLLPSPPAKGLTVYGNIDLISFMIFALMLPACFNSYFLKAWKNYYGSIKSGPITLT